MIPELRRSFNARFTPEKYRAVLARLERDCGVPVQFRNCETPCFFPVSLVNRMLAAADELLAQVVAEPCRSLPPPIPEQFNTPGEPDHPLFVQVDFGLVRNSNGGIDPKLVEIQGFPSLYAYQAALAEAYRDVYDLDRDLSYLAGGMTPQDYCQRLRQAILGDERPANVVLMEIDPLHQKTLPDFLLTERLLGIPTVDAAQVVRQNRRLYYLRDGRQIPIHRIYNRVIADEVVRKRIKLPFRFSDELDVRWAGHPNWFFKLSKFTIPHFHHPSVPRTWYLDQLDPLPGDLSPYVLKPLFSFAGQGVLIGPTRDQVLAIPPPERSQYLLQERLEFEPVIETPYGLTKVEVRIMYIWMERPVAGPLLLRTGRGAMMGVNYNRDMPWVGASAGFVPGS